MAEREVEYPLGTPQEHVLMCANHSSMPVDMTCEDCEEFICSKCVKEDHKDHNWQTIQTAVNLMRRGLLKSMRKIEEEDIKQMDEKIQTSSLQIEENKRQYKLEVSELQRHYETIVEKLDKIRKQHEKALRQSLERKNGDVKKLKSGLEEKKKNVLQQVKFLKENSRIVTDILLLKTHRELTKLLSTKEDYKENSKYLLRYESGDINETVLEYMIGETFDVGQISVTETNSFQCGDEAIWALEAINEETCLSCNAKLTHLEQVTKNGKKEKMFRVDVSDMCVTDNNDVYIANFINKSICRLSPSGSITTAFRTAPLTPRGVCQIKYGNLLVILVDTESDRYQPDSRSRRLVRHVTLTGDVIREYEYQEDGQTRLFTWPAEVTQNNNTNICVINKMSKATSELVTLSVSGSLKSVYPEQNPKEVFNLMDVVCDSHCNIIVCEVYSSTIHLLTPQGRFIRYLMIENQVNHPSTMCLKKSTLWIGDSHGLIKVFQYKS